LTLPNTCACLPLGYGKVAIARAGVIERRTLILALLSISLLFLSSWSAFAIARYGAPGTEEQGVAHLVLFDEDPGSSAATRAVSPSFLYLVIPSLSPHSAEAIAAEVYPSDTKTHFEGTVQANTSSQDTWEFLVSVDEWLGGNEPCDNPIIVRLPISPDCTGVLDSSIAVGDKVEVYGDLPFGGCYVSLCWDGYMKRISAACCPCDLTIYKEAYNYGEGVEITLKFCGPPETPPAGELVCGWVPYTQPFSFRQIEGCDNITYWIDCNSHADLCNNVSNYTGWYVRLLNVTLNGSSMIVGYDSIERIAGCDDCAITEACDPDSFTVWLHEDASATSNITDEFDKLATGFYKATLSDFDPGAKTVEVSVADCASLEEDFVVAAPGEVVDCININTPGVYTLVNNIPGSAAECCINITASDVTFDGNDHYISAAEVIGVERYATGVCVGSNQTLSNVTVKNLSSVWNWDVGISFSGVDNGRIANNGVRWNKDYGILVINSSRIEITQNDVDSNMDGIFLMDSSNNSITNNTAEANYGGIGFIRSSDNEVINNIASGNYFGIDFYQNSNNNQISKNTVRYNLYHGVYLDTSCTGNTLYQNLVCTNNQIVGDYYDICDNDTNSGDNNACDSTYQWDDTGTSGCTFGCTNATSRPTLCTDPDLLDHDFGVVPKRETRTWFFNLSNCYGIGTLTWSISSDQPWLTVSPSSGSTTTETDLVTVTVNTSNLLACETHEGNITISTTDGMKTGTVNVTVTGPRLCTEPDPLGHDFDAIPKGETEEWSFNLTNCCNETLTWSISSDQPWLTVTPFSNSTTTETETITVMVNTTRLLPCDTYTGNITITTNDGTKTGAFNVTVTGPRLCTEPDPPDHDFGDVLEGETKEWSFTITNRCNETLTWSISSDRSWITVDTPSDATTTEMDTVTIRVNTTGLQPRTAYRGNITVTTNDGITTGLISVYVAGRPEIMVTRGPVERHGTGFSVSLNLTNVGAALASNIEVADRVTGFQALPYGDWWGLCGRSVETSYNYYAKECEVRFTIPELGPSNTTTLTYYITPVLYESIPAYSIGDSTNVSYDGIAGDTYQKDFSIPATQVKLNPGSYQNIADATNFTVKLADYVIVTHPNNLFLLYNATEVNVLLATMAQLAYLEDGVLGYFNSTSASTLDNLIEPFGGWANQLNSTFSLVGGGYVLIVGETEIVPSWPITGFAVKFPDKVVNEVNFTDHPYADTTGDGGAPELIVGRIIGDSNGSAHAAAQLTIPINASISVHEGKSEFDRSHAVLVSGTDDDDAMQADFVEQVNDLAELLQHNSTVTTIHWHEYKDYYKLSSFGRDYEEHDGFAVGDVMGGSDEEIVLGDRSANKIYIYNSSGTELANFSRDFEEGDGLAVGDVCLWTKDEIIIADQSDNKIHIYNETFTELAWFARSDIEGFDGLAVGDVIGGAYDEIIVADRSQNKIYVYDAWANELASFSVSDYEEHDGFAVGDVALDPSFPKEDIVIADRSADKFYIYNVTGAEYTSRGIDNTCDFEEGDGLAVGNVMGKSAGDEIIIGDRSADKISIRSPEYSNYPLANIRWNFESFDGLAAGNLLGGVYDEIIIADRDDSIYITDAQYKGRMLTALKGAIPSGDILVYIGHGFVTAWDEGLDIDDFPLNFSTISPFVFALACLTGNYEVDHADRSIAENFLASGAAVYIGSTQLSPDKIDNAAKDWFFTNWDTDESIGTTLFDLERTKFSTNEWWKYWTYEYNLYGDPKFGAVDCGTSGASQSARLHTPGPSLEITIPDYVVTTRDGYDYVEIPGGDLLLENGEYRLPYYPIFVDYPKGQRVQEVMLTDRSGLVNDTGLNIPITATRCHSAIGERHHASAQSAGWIPSETHRWEVIENPDGSTTLLIMIFPFYYDPDTTNVQFYREYSFDIESITTSTEITSLATNEDAYPQGEPIMINLTIMNSGPAQDVVINASIKRYGSDELVDVLAPVTIEDLSGETACSLEWDSAGFATGYHYVEVTAHDLAGNLLDKETEMFRLGIASGEITALAATPRYFEVGDVIDIAMTFNNTGTVNITGVAVTKITNASSGTVAAEYRFNVSDLAPSAAIALNASWDTSGAQEGTYSIISYVLYDGKSTSPLTFTVSTVTDVFDTGPGTYPSIAGNHTGTIKPAINLYVSKLYTYNCPGTGGHTEYVRIWNETGTVTEGYWHGYQADYSNLTLTPSVTLVKDHEYHFTIITGSYPLLHQNATLLLPAGEITCTEFTDANGRIAAPRIPAIKFF
jgi:parallel beta-helix repeat protein